MQFPKVSVIVPVYNVEAYLRQCLESLINQTLQEIEFICINDGSNDSSLEILYEFKKKDKRIRVVDKKNTGYGDTVNIGINMAAGEYIGILESDDFATLNMYKILYEKAIEYDADLVKGNYYCYYGEETKKITWNYLDWLPYNKLLTSQERNILIFSEPAIWAAIYKKSFLKRNKILFLTTPGASYQDLSFAYKTAFVAEKVICLKDPLLYYRKDNENSSVKDEKKIFCVCDEFEEILTFIMQRKGMDKLAVYSKAMYYRYKWNIERLKIESRPKFLLRMYCQFRKACFSGWLDKKYWNDLEWDFIHRFIFDYSTICETIMGNDQEKTLELQYNKLFFFFFCDSHPLLVYGAGKRCRKLINLLRENEIYPDGIMVTNLYGNPSMVDNIPVFDVEYVSKNERDALILLGVSEHLKKEIIDILCDKGLGNNYFDTEHNLQLELKGE